MHIVSALVGAGKGTTTFPARTSAQLAKGYDHQPTTDFTRIRETNPQWSGWTDEECKQYLVLETLNAFGLKRVTMDPDHKWKLTPKGMKDLAPKGEPDPIAIEKALGNNFTFDLQADLEPEMKPVRSKKGERRTLSASWRYNVPEQKAFIDKLEWALAKTGLTGQSFAEVAIKAMVDKLENEEMFHKLISQISDDLNRDLKKDMTRSRNRARST
jgi:hypothetical protein